MSEEFDPYQKWLGIRTPERPPNHYALLGLALFEADRETIVHAADRQMTHVRRFQSGSQLAQSQRILNELAVAKLCLMKAEKKEAYDKQLRTRLAELEPARAPQPPRPPIAPPPVAPPSIERAEVPKRPAAPSPAEAAILAATGVAASRAVVPPPFVPSRVEEKTSHVEPDKVDKAVVETAPTGKPCAVRTGIDPSFALELTTGTGLRTPKRTKQQASVASLVAMLVVALILSLILAGLVFQAS